jgi:hypothetical protein
MMHSEFATNYGYLIQHPKDDVLAYIAYGVNIEKGCNVQFIDCNDGYMYVECVTKEEMEAVCDPIYVADYRDVTEDRPRVQVWFRDMLKRNLDNGTLKFIDEESLVVLSEKFKYAFQINIQI